jgi:hypothetical protein
MSAPVLNRINRLADDPRKAVKAMSKVVAKLMGRERPAAMKSHSDE